MDYNLLNQSVSSSNLTKREIAQGLGISRNTLDAILNGKTDARVSYIEQIAQMIGVKPAIFFDSSDVAVTSIGNKDSNIAGRDLNLGTANTKLLLRIKELETKLEAIEHLANERKEMLDFIMPLVRNFSEAGQKG